MPESFARPGFRTTRFKQNTMAFSHFKYASSSSTYTRIMSVEQPAVAPRAIDAISFPVALTRFLYLVQHPHHDGNSPAGSTAREIVWNRPRHDHPLAKSVRGSRFFQSAHPHSVVEANNPILFQMCVCDSPVLPFRDAQCVVTSRRTVVVVVVVVVLVRSSSSSGSSRIHQRV